MQRLFSISVSLLFVAMLTAAPVFSKPSHKSHNKPVHPKAHKVKRHPAVQH